MTKLYILCNTPSALIICFKNAGRLSNQSSMFLQQPSFLSHNFHEPCPVVSHESTCSLSRTTVNISSERRSCFRSHSTAGLTNPPLFFPETLTSFLGRVLECLCSRTTINVQGHVRTLDSFGSLWLPLSSRI